MGQPTEPTPGAPATEPTPPTPGAPALNLDGPFDAGRAAKLVENLRAELAAERTKRTTAETEAADQLAELRDQAARALGLKPEDVDPAELAAAVEQAEAQAWVAGVELQLHRLAAGLGVDAERLLDSRAFIDSLDDLTDSDPRSAEFATAVKAKVEAALERNPSFKAGQASATTTGQGPGVPKPDPSQGSGKQPVTPRPTSLIAAVKQHYTDARKG